MGCLHCNRWGWWSFEVSSTVHVETRSKAATTATGAVPAATVAISTRAITMAAAAVASSSGVFRALTVPSVGRFRVGGGGLFGAAASFGGGAGAATASAAASVTAASRVGGALCTSSFCLLAMSFPVWSRLLLVFLCVSSEVLTSGEHGSNFAITQQKIKVYLRHLPPLFGSLVVVIIVVVVAVGWSLSSSP